MPEAEDVLIEAAERATYAVRAAWERRRGAPGRGESPAATASHRRLAAWQVAWLGESWPVAAAIARPRPGLLARRLRRLPPWETCEAAAPFTDGRQIWLPRTWLEGSGETPALVSTLGLAWRLARQTIADIPHGDRLHRDLYWLCEGALAEAALARAWPGLVADLLAFRRARLAQRPDPSRLSPVERAVEAWLRDVIATQPTHLSASRLAGLAPGSEPAEVLAFAADRAAEFSGQGARYRGVAPVTHWGVPHAAAQTPPAPATHAASPRGAPARRTGGLRRPLQRREPDPGEDERMGPFVIPFSDPHLTVDDPGGLVRPPDSGHDEDLETLTEELARLDELTVVRHDAPVREVLEAGEPGRTATPQEMQPDSASGLVWLYPEWDAVRGSYRDPGCRVRELPTSVIDGGWAAATLSARRQLLARISRALECLRPRRQRLRRQIDGDDVDLSGWVEEWADRCAGRTPAGRVYSQERALRRDIAVTLLLDTSGSTESWLSGGQRVIDIVKEAALVFGEALAALGDRFALLSFSGQGAADVRVRRLKGFGERAGVAVQRRIGALEPDAFTRLGGALRHATAGLAREPARVRLLLILSDGKPQDEDGYEGRYGIEDVRQAVAEARLQGVRIFGVTVDREGPAYLPRLFGPYGYTVIWNADALPDRLPAIYRQLTSRA